MTAPKRPGWQQPATCSHMGIFGAVFTLGSHPVGHRWVCTCGKVFVVVNGANGSKRLAPEETGEPA